MILVTSKETTDEILGGLHYLGRCRRSVLNVSTDAGVIVFTKPASRALPNDGTWLELSRWCLFGGKNDGSRQWAETWRWLKTNRPEVSTVVSYSDPSVGHTGALYRACNWLWAPTWHRLRPPPSGNGRWSTKMESVKDRWIFPLSPDDRRGAVLCVRDEAIRRAKPWAEYREPRWKHDRPILATGGGNYQRWRSEVTP